MVKVGAGGDRSASRPAGIGVLLVPGLAGERRRTLVHVADAMHAWITSWVAHVPPSRNARRPPADDDPVILAGTRLELEGDECPHALLKLADGPAILLAESRWTAHFRNPPVGALATWSLRVVPFLLLEHVNKAVFRTVLRARQRRRSWLELPPLLTGLLVALPVGIALVAGLMLVVLLARLKVPGFAWIGRWLEVRVSIALGDSFVLTSSPTQLADVVECVARELRWLAERTDVIAVVSLSQGAAIAHQAIRRESPGALRLFATVGSGLRAFHAVPDALNRRSEPLKTLGWLLFSLMFIGLWAYVAVVVVSAVLSGTAGVGTILAGAAWLAMHFFYLLFFRDRLHSGDAPLYADALRLPGAGTRFEWADYFASADPIPNGSLVVDSLHPSAGWAEPVRLHNEASLWRDHRGYLANPEQFLADVLRRLGTAGGIAALAFEGADREHAARAWRRRTWRVRWLAAGRSLLGIACGLAVIRFSSAVEDAGAEVLAAVPGVLRDVIDEPLAALADLLPGDFGPPGFIGLALAAAGVLVANRAQRLVWLTWERHDVERFFRRQAPDAGGTPFVLYAGLCATLLTVALAITPLADLLAGWFSPVADLLAGIPGLAEATAIMICAGLALLIAGPSRSDQAVFMRLLGGASVAVGVVAAFTGKLPAPLSFTQACAAVGVGGLAGGALGLALRWAGRMWTRRAEPGLVLRSTRPAEVPRLRIAGATALVVVRHPGRLTGLDLIGDDLLATAGEDGTARLWSVADGEEVARLRHDGGVTGISVSPDGARVATACADGHARLWQVADGVVVASLPHRLAPEDVAFAPDGGRVAVAVGRVGLWELATGDVAWLRSDGHFEVVVWAANASRLAARGTGRYSRAAVWDAQSRERIFHASPDSYDRGLALSDDGTLLAVASSSELPVDAIDADTRHFTARAGGLMLDVNAAAFDGGGTRIAAGRDDGMVRFWTLDGQREKTCIQRTVGIQSLRWRGDLLAVGCADGSAAVFDVPQTLDPRPDPAPDRREVARGAI